MIKPIAGYAEGYYGRLPCWAERRQILDTLQRLGLTTYYYAPKEDPCHRLHWRTPYSMQWRQEFRAFCVQAEQQGIDVVAGVAPGLDFDFSHLPEGDDFKHLVSKSELFLEDGAHAISLLMDDIDADFEKRCGEFVLEGQAHAALANALGDALQASKFSTDNRSENLWVTPRIYADELIASAPDYLSSFLLNLNHHHHVLYCGSDVVAYALNESSKNALSAAVNGSGQDAGLKHRVIIWDNLYANDYCPRRLFVGAWQRRETLSDVLLNPTGMVYTDCLLLELMSASMTLGKTTDAQSSNELEVCRRVLSSQGVPDEFMPLLPFFNHPVFNTGKAEEPCVDSKAVRDAIEYCLWRWKTPLSREWYPAIFGLKHDLLTFAGEHRPLRIRKTQNAPLAQVLEQRVMKPG